ncbi:MAG: hypothetical protein FWD17_19940, partial [Polyangiaceae bacterium]|nr:hypothetical protein [Polyangiaceae bacterium]
MKYRLLGLLAFAGAACNASDALLGAGPDAGGTSASTVSQSAASQPTPSQSTTSTPTVAASDAGGCDVDPCPRTLVTPPPNMVPMAIAVDDTQVYWSAFPAGPPPIAGGSGGLVARTDEPGAVQRVGRDGGTAEFVVQGVPLGWGAIGADGTNVYWTVPSDGGSALSYPQFMDAGTGSVMRAPTDGGPSSVVASGQPWPTDVLADPGGVFWMNGSGWPVGGATIGIEDTTGSVVALPAGAPAPVVLASNQNDLQRMAIDATSVVWCANNDGTINVAPRDGGPPVVVAAYYRCGSVAVNVDGVFFVINGATYQAGSAPDKPTQIGPSGGLLAADDHHVYVATGDSIVRIATAPGADTTPVTVANDTGIMDFTVDATGIFWTTWDPIAQVGAVRMVAKGPDGTGDGSVTCPANAQVAELPSGPCTGTGGCTVHWVASCDSGIPAIPVTPPTYDCECASGAWSCTQTGGGLGLIGCTAEDASSA